MSIGDIIMIEHDRLIIEMGDIEKLTTQERLRLARLDR